MLCIATAAGVLALAVEGFSLEWTHSTARQRWLEIWEVAPKGLRPLEAEISGPGAGMELPANAVRVAGGWRYRVELPLLPEVLLAASGETPDPWTLCSTAGCHDLGATAGAPVRLWSAPSCTEDAG